MGASVDARLETLRLLPGRRRPLHGRPSSRARPAAACRCSSAVTRACPRAGPRRLAVRDIAKRELAIVRERLELERDRCRVEAGRQLGRAGQRADHRDRVAAVTEVVTGFGEKRCQRRERSRRTRATRPRRYLAADVPVGSAPRRSAPDPDGAGRRRHVPDAGADGAHDHECGRDSAVPRRADRRRTRGQRHPSSERRIGSQGTGVMKTRDLARMGIPAGRCAETAKQILQKAHAAKRSMARFWTICAASPPRRASHRDDRDVWRAGAAAARSRRGGRSVPAAGRGRAVPDLGREPRAGRRRSR